MDLNSVQGFMKPKPYNEFTQTNSQPQETLVSIQEQRNNKHDFEKEIAGINKWLQSTSSHVKFTLHEDLNEYYVQVINDQTNEVIREIPSKKVMDMVAKMHEMIGLLVDEKR
ncbi:flagellar protein FlaG [Brevibacillus sp. DP1.3A]|uniref:flagellar protein FlaG n=1 Tax=Brevibacillus sp. DP1.3A TaxID=2738867 RepID=UPI00156A9BF4|nr:flagellar protein FlaG [Brevibacillus sp. DP1.3A]UED75581.1 flagellar protein FlaG [Brevibacillus sp. DP1.3A]